MRKISFLIILISLSMAATAQRGHHRGSDREFDLELRGGLNMCQIDGDASGNYNKMGFHAAVASSFPLSDDDRLRFAVEIGLTQKGSRIAGNALDRHISLLYVEVPLMLAYDLTESRALRLAAGLAPAILAKSNVTTDGSYDPLQSDNYKRLDALPVVLSLRYRFTNHLGADLRFYNSMLNMAIENGSGTYRIFRSNKGQFNRLLQVGLTVDF